MTELSVYDLANHWPFLRSHLLFRESAARPNAEARALELLCKQLVLSGGEAVPMSRKRLATFGLTAGQVGRTWAALVELQRRGVVTRWAADLGRRPDLWTLSPFDFGRRWRAMPWRWSGREPQLVVEHCDCAARSCSESARFPGQSVAGPRQDAPFKLPPWCHLDLRGVFRDTTAQERAAFDTATRENEQFARGNGAASHLSPVGRRTPSSSFGHGEHEPGTDDEALRVLRQAVEESTGGVLFGQPLDRLAAVAARCNGELQELAKRLREDGSRTRSPVTVADRAPQHLAVLHHEAALRGQEAVSRDRQRLDLLLRLDPAELGDEETREIEQLRGSLGVDA